MEIVADENIPFVSTVFANLGEVRTLIGRQINRADLGDAEVLLVRSVTQVDENLLAGSAVRFVGTATIGLDHIDLDYLSKKNIAFASAQGSNATSAAEYVISALLIIAERQGFQLHEKTVGIIGCGNVGSRVLKKLKALGVECIIHDPPLQEKTDNRDNRDNRDYVDLNAVLCADIITLHVPLTKGGRYPTEHLINADFLSKLQDDVILVNTSRGGVVDERALLERQRPTMTTILDVWKNEPNINQLLLQRATLGTPHIAGYSFDGKVRGTEMLYAAVCDYFQQTPQAQITLPAPPLRRLTFSHTIDDQVAIQSAVMACYDVRRDDAALRRSALDASAYFDNLRKNYPRRREFSCVEIELPAEKSALAAQLRGLGFIVRHHAHATFAP
ncbi:hypothetical protein PN36_29400 [Candidatus Thiomargarita nelsonii]|uniref:Erythronate-4-phosphate dehydrogenase n=1 Tax=Candidatus Thiomargarita nelsonii TaxID=1003181 RepID=A0A4E0QSA3_9GAMM|nr:hypothetical protein PN36_29400 [Candidatus Thiomargarita nelsonii]